MIDFLKKVWSWIVNIPKDKLLHDYAGALIGLFGFAIAFIFTSYWWAFLVGNALAVFCLVAKEIYDVFMEGEGHSAELADIGFGLFGLAKVDLALLLMLIGM